MQMLGDSYGPLLRDRHVVVHKSQMNRCSVVDLLSYRPKASDQAHMLHPQLACLKLVWKPAMRSHRNGWRKVMHERLCWQRISSSVCKDSDTLSYKGLVLPLYAFLETEACYAFITGHIPNSCPLSVLGRLAPLPEPILQVLFAQMALAIHICHKSGILLRCLHRNSFVFDSHCNCVLVDFQSAKVAIRSSSTRLPEHGIEYLAPEQIRSQSYSKSADWFAIGLLLLELIVGSSPLTTYCSQKKIPLNSDQGGNCIIRPPNHVLLACKLHAWTFAKRFESNLVNRFWYQLSNKYSQWSICVKQHRHLNCYWKIFCVWWVWIRKKFQRLTGQTLISGLCSRLIRILNEGLEVNRMHFIVFKITNSFTTWIGNVFGKIFNKIVMSLSLLIVQIKWSLLQILHMNCRSFLKKTILVQKSVVHAFQFTIYIHLFHFT